MNKIPKQLYFYITKTFLIRFVNVVLAISLLLLFTNLFDISDKVDKQVKWYTTLQIASLAIPAHLENMSIFLVMVAAMITIHGFSSKSEITIMRSAGLSLWQVLYPLIFCSFILGVIAVTIFGPLTVMANKKYNLMEQKYINQEVSDVLAPPDGIWLKQQNILKSDEEIIIRAKKVYKDNLKLSEVNLWFFDDQGRFYKKIDASQMLLLDDYWELNDVTINDDNNVNRKMKNLQVLTDLKPQFIMQKIINNFENVKLFSVFDLPKLITNLEESGFSSRKFKIYYYSLLNKPFLFMVMSLVAAFFTINNVRSRGNLIIITSGVMIGLILYIGLSVINAFGESGLVPTQVSTWLMTLILLTIAILLTYRKDSV